MFYSRKVICSFGAIVLISLMVGCGGKTNGSNTAGLASMNSLGSAQNNAQSNVVQENPLASLPSSLVNLSLLSVTSSMQTYYTFDFFTGKIKPISVKVWSANFSIKINDPNAYGHIWLNTGAGCGIVSPGSNTVQCAVTSTKSGSESVIAYYYPAATGCSASELSGGRGIATTCPASAPVTVNFQ